MILSLVIWYQQKVLTKKKRYDDRIEQKLDIFLTQQKNGNEQKA